MTEAALEMRHDTLSEVAPAFGTGAPTPPPGDRRLIAVHHVALTVRDRDASAAWYGEVLGFHELFREDDEHRKAAILCFPAGGYSVALVEHTGTDPDAFNACRSGLDHLAFTVASRDDLDTWADWLTTAGIEHSGPITVAPGAIVNFNDPDGVALALFCDHQEGTNA